MTVRHLQSHLPTRSSSCHLGFAQGSVAPEHLRPAGTIPVDWILGHYASRNGKRTAEASELTIQGSLPGINLASKPVIVYDSLASESQTGGN